MKARSCWLLLAALGLGLTGCGDPGTPRPRRFSILATGFMRGQVDDYERSRRMGHKKARFFGGAGRMNTLLADVRTRRRQQGRRVLAFDLGDFLSGSPEAEATSGGSSVAIVASRDYDAVLLGNRELNFGQERLYELMGGPGGPPRIPLVSTNVFLTKQSPGIFGKDWRRRRPPSFARPALELPGGEGDIPARVLGFTPGNLDELVEPEHLEGLAVDRDVGKVLRLYAPGLEGDGELTVLLTQTDVFAHRDELVAAVAGSGVDMVIGHAYGKGAVAYQEGGCWFAGVRNDLPGSALVEWTVTVNPETGRIETLTEGYYVLLGRKPGRDYLNREAGLQPGEKVDPHDLIPPDKALLDALAPYKKELARLNEALTETEKDLHGAYEEESELGNLVADALRGADPTADVAMISAGVVGHNRIRAGKILRRDIGKLFPYQNQLHRLRMPGSKIREALEGMVSRRIHVLLSGIRYSYRDDGGTPELVGKIEIGGKPLSPGKTYTVVLNSFAHRRDPVFKTFEGKPIGDCQEILLKYLEDADSVSPRIEGRLTRVR